MSRIVLVAVALIAAGWTSSAQAADLSYGSRPLHRQPAAQLPIAGPVPISAAISARTGVRSTTTRPSRPVSSAACKPATTGRSVLWYSASKATSRATAPTILCAVEILQPLVRHRPWPGRLRHQQRPVLRHRGSRVRRIDRPTFGLSESHTNAGWTVGSAPKSASPGTGAPRSNISMSICTTATSRLPASRTATGSDGARRRELSLLKQQENIDYRKLPAASRPGFFCAYASRGNAQAS